jgi:lysyl-tRNA synthetase class II
MTQPHAANPAPHATDDNQLIAERREKLKALREAGVAFPNDFKPRHQAAELHQRFGQVPNEELEPQGVRVVVAGRMMLKRVMGKACFATLQDASGRIQLYVTQDAVGTELLAAFKHWDLGDILGCEGTLFRTKTGELSVKAGSIRLLVKSLRPLPDKFHGMTDQEQKYRQRYVDLMTDDDARTRFVARSKAVSSIRGFMVEHGFLEVETPMLHPIPGGANAKPFVTHHNALDQEMFLRIAPELYLKRLLVGGFERVFEINRNFRNEGISVRHNPEFTMMEFYAAYWTHHDLMDFTEQLLRHAARQATGSATLTYAGRTVDLEPAFARLTVRQSLVVHAGLAGRHEHANDRHSTFILEGLRDLAADLDRLGIPFSCSPGDRGRFAALVAESCLVVTEDFPVAPFPAWTDAIATRYGRATFAVDTACVVPMNVSRRSFDRAFAFRDATEAERRRRVPLAWPACPALALLADVTRSSSADFPLPVAPTTPNVSPAASAKLTEDWTASMPAPASSTIRSAAVSTT